METKSLFASTTFWMVAINVAMKIVTIFFAIDLEDEQIKVAIDNFATIMPMAISFFCDLGAIYGRMKANTKIK